MRKGCFSLPPWCHSCEICNTVLSGSLKTSKVIQICLLQRSRSRIRSMGSVGGRKTYGRLVSLVCFIIQRFTNPNCERKKGRKWSKREEEKERMMRGRSLSHYLNISSLLLFTDVTEHGSLFSFFGARHHEISLGYPFFGSRRWRHVVGNRTTRTKIVSDFTNIFIV